ncbi:MAG: TetR/AcrR family transcriptional regulator [Cyclobacteriaceae bacterium]|nr:TetR/AcrR family transcriptional regulator [Cyclobacteriaceae bacterium]
MATLAFKLNEHLYLRDPQHTQLGQNIIQKSVEMIDRLGFEQFTFKKLAEEINSTEASIYRYFENKHKLLVYLISWYWHWIEYRIDIASGSLQNPSEKLRACLRVLADEKKFDAGFEFVNEEALHRIVVAELDKTYQTKGVDDYNKEGLFGGFKSVCRKITTVILEVNPSYPYAASLVSTILVSSNQQLFFSEHLPSLTTIGTGQERYTQLYKFMENIVFKSIQS